MLVAWRILAAIKANCSSLIPQTSTSMKRRAFEENSA
jgi:hypothetical protein